MQLEQIDEQILAMLGQEMLHEGILFRLASSALACDYIHAIAASQDIAGTASRILAGQPFGVALLLHLGSPIDSRISWDFISMKPSTTLEGIKMV